MQNKKILLAVAASTLTFFSITTQATDTINTIENTKNISAPLINDTTENNPLSGTFDLTSNYIFRGISQSDNLPAVQGGLTYTFFNPGIYFNIFGSNVKFPDKNGDTATLELDALVGIANTIGENFNYDFALTRYSYPKAAGVNYNEFITNLSYYFLTGQIGYSNDVYASGENGTYYNLGVNYDIPAHYIFNVTDVNVKASTGHYSLPHNAGLNSYNDYLLQISKTINAYVLAVQWTGTNGRANNGSLDDDHLVGTVTVNF